MKLTESIHIESAPEVVFDLTQDYSKRLIWDKFLKKADLIDSREAKVGTKAWCVSKHGLGMETAYVSFKRPKVTAIKQTKRSVLFHKFSGSWVFEPVSSNSTRVIFTYSYSLNFPFNVMVRIIHGILKKNVQQRLRDLKSFAETNNVAKDEHRIISQ